MKKSCVLIFTILFCALSFAQEETTNWAFGNNAGLNFDLTTGNVTPIITSISTSEGCSTISDENGILQFYTDGRTVWNRNHQIMPNGNYFGGTGLLGDPSSTSSGVIVPHPTNNNLYYIFTVDEPHHNNAWASPNQGPADQNGNPLNFYEETFGDFQSVPNDDDGFNNGFNYSLVDMTLNGGFGDVVTTEKNVHLITYDTSQQDQTLYKCAEKITAVQGADCETMWVITQFVDTFYAFKIDANGFNDLTPVTSIVPPNITTQGYRRNGIGYMKSSPDGTKIAVCHAQNGVFPSDDNAAPDTGSFWIYDFDNATGQVSNPVNLISDVQSYGTEFSADSKKVYVTNGSVVRQFDLEDNNSETIVHQQPSGFISAMQLAPNNKIYVCNQSNPISLDVIEQPAEAGLACTYNVAGQSLAGGTSATLGLPPFITSFLGFEIDIIRNGISTTELRLCTGDSYTLQADDITGADYVWSFDGNPIPGNNQAQLFIDTPGFYEVYIEPNNGDCPIEGSAVVGVFDIPVANPVTDITACDDFGNDGIFGGFDFTNKNSEALATQSASQYNVRYFESMDDANNLENEITFPYTNINNPQTIYVRVDNTDNTNCFDVTSFQLEVFNTPQIVQLNNIEFCDNEGDPTDGFATIELGDLIPSIRGAQSEADTNITFHSTQQDADDNVSQLPLSYSNTTAVNETIFVRIENTNSTDCYSTGSFQLTINDAPIANNITIVQCDEDDIPEGFTTFNIGSFSDDVINNEANRTVTYYLSLVDAENEENEIDADAFDNFFNPQIVYARVTNTSTGCVSFSEVSLEVSTTSSNNASLAVCDDDGNEDGFANFNLNDTNAIVLAGAPAGLNLQYYETYEDALVEANPLSTNFTNTIPNNQTIYARVENSNACYGISEIELTVYELPNIETEFETLYCLNSFPETIVLDAGIINDAPSNYLFDWSTGENTSTIEVDAPGTYNVRVSNVNGCFKDRTITVLPSNIATIDNIEIVDASNNNSITVLVSGEGDYEYALDDINGPYQDSNVFEDISPGLYTVFVRDKNDCGIADELVSVIGFPKFFTPNGDGSNEFWQVRGINNQFQANSLILIFDRYGKLLTKLNPLGPGWDGTYNGANMPASDYWFKVELEDGRVFTSHFSLKR
ncbi:T9SS type B sorting domain-containing protein [Winogradskyella sp. HB-48]|uniref:T9SS type B sorting domain-containing protein n=1 Tax=Winogradskyella sp. HB-48 TaxID=3416808 RepID=UPI003CF46D79